eukprot:3318548-Prymnesium_polylepis.1
MSVATVRPISAHAAEGATAESACVVDKITNIRTAIWSASSVPAPSTLVTPLAPKLMTPGAEAIEPA